MASTIPRAQAQPDAARIRRRIDTPIPRWVTGLLVACLLLLPAWLFWDHLRYPALAVDDFDYVSNSRDLDRLRANLFEPHNTHIVPLFRIWTFLLVKTAGRLTNLPLAVSLAAYLAFVLALLALGHLVRRVTGNRAAGLVAMAVLGLSTLNLTVVTWYSAGQALCAGTAILVALISLEAWLGKGGAWRLGMAILATVAAPGLWMGGILAGPAAAAFLWSAGGPGLRRLALAFLLISVCEAGLLVGAVRMKMDEVGNAEQRRISTAAKSYQAVRSTVIAIPESLVLRNLGVDAALTGVQGLVFCLLIAGLWQRGGPRHPNRLEAAGLVMVVGCYLMIFYFRGYMAYEDMRVVGWYNAIPAVGAILWAAGWWSRDRVPSSAPGPPAARMTRRGLIVVIASVAGLVLLHLPRAERLRIEGAPRMEPIEAARFPIPELQRLRALLYAEVNADRQRRMLLRLERAEEAARALGLGRVTVRNVFGRLHVPGILENQMSVDAVSLLALPDDDRQTVAPEKVRQALGRYMTPEPEYRPPWLSAPGDRPSGA